MSSLTCSAIRYRLGDVASLKDFERKIGRLGRGARWRGCDLLVLPEYCTFDLLGVVGPTSSVNEQLAGLANLEKEYRAILSDLAQSLGLYVVGGSLPVARDSALVPVCFVAAPCGTVAEQAKLHLTRLEREIWEFVEGTSLQIFSSSFGKFVILLCYDIEFPELARLAAEQAAEILVVPACTRGRAAFDRVRYCALARAVENQMYVVQAATVGDCAVEPDGFTAYGSAAILTPCDEGFPQGGVLSETTDNGEGFAEGRLDLEAIRDVRRDGTVRTLADWQDDAGREIKVGVVDLEQNC